MLYHGVDSQHTQRSKSIKLLVKMKNVSFILWKKSNRLFGQPNISSDWSQGKNRANLSFCFMLSGTLCYLIHT